ncbi:hypothetical protein [Paenibacillus sp. Marseille-Q4541]|uniref:hypothetical protein n=1 Tax=Paenibacillus sp. Marseille-Q4541 TaxID=2831522 RepID=UPI001BA8CD3C|nr:hypothetical protein [Paenibacillus sp. Marseille-Q4541]
MSFQPNPGDQIHINGITYLVGQHPAAPGIAYAQTGRQGTVYKLIPADGNEYESKALKVFFPKFRVPAMVYQSEQMEKYSEVSGLQVCNRDVLTPERNGKLISEHGDLLYSVLMPWISGITWFDIICDKKLLTPSESLTLAASFAGIGSAMEQRGIAHCDLSAPNVLIPFFSEVEQPEGSSAVELVDVEQIYSPKMDRPDALLAGSAGYAAHRIVNSGLWSSYADRFAGAVILAEMLGYSDQDIVQRTYGESYFDQRELQTSCDRYIKLLQFLERRYGRKISELFSRAWNSQDLSSCPTFGEWLIAISTIELQPEVADLDESLKNSSEKEHVPTGFIYSDEGKNELPSKDMQQKNSEFDTAVVPLAHDTVTNRIWTEQEIQQAIKDARVLENQGEYVLAMEKYQSVLPNTQSGSAVFVEISAAIKQLERDQLQKEESQTPKAPLFFLRNRKILIAAAAVAVVGAIAIPGMHTLADRAETKQALAQQEAQQLKEQEEMKKQAEAQQAQEAAKLAEEKKKQEAEALAKKNADEVAAKLTAQKEKAALQEKYEKQAKYEAYLAKVAAQKEAAEKAELQEKYEKQAKYEKYVAEQQAKKAKQAEESKKQKEAAAKLAAQKAAEQKLAAQKAAAQKAAAQKAAQKAAAEKKAKEEAAALKKKRAENVVQLIASYNLAYNAQQGRKIESARTHARAFMDRYEKDASYYSGVGKISERVKHIKKFISNRSYRLPDI